MDRAAPSDTAPIGRVHDAVSGMQEEHVRYTVNLLDAAIDPVEWARRREAEGWDGLSVADHVFTGRRAYPHVWVTATAMAMATTRPTISTAFANNLHAQPGRSGPGRAPVAAGEWRPIRTRPRSGLGRRRGHRVGAALSATG